MPLSDFLAAANLIAVVSVPVVGGLIAFFHRANRQRWDAVDIQLRKARKLAKRALMQHVGFEGRLTRLEDNLQSRNRPQAGTTRN